jgi:hypothetical protein
MLFLNRRGRKAALVVLVSLIPGVASAQGPSLALPTIAASAAAAADWATTYHALKYYRVREVNPLLQSFRSSPGQLISVGAAIDVGAVSAWNLAIGRSSPRLAIAGLWSMAAFRAYLAIHNRRNENAAPRR